MSVLLGCIFIALARVTDITLDTVRTVAIVQGRRLFASVLGFFEAAVYIIAVAKVLQDLPKHYWYAVAYATGFAAGTFLGIVVDQTLAFGQQLLTVFTRQGSNLVIALRQEGYRLTEFSGHGRDGAVHSLFIQVPRRSTRRLIARVRALDPSCFYIINDVRVSSAVQPMPGDNPPPQAKLSQPAP